MRSSAVVRAAKYLRDASLVLARDFKTARRRYLLKDQSILHGGCGFSRQICLHRRFAKYDDDMLGKQVDAFDGPVQQRHRDAVLAGRRCPAGHLVAVQRDGDTMELLESRAEEGFRGGRDPCIR